MNNTITNREKHLNASTLVELGYRDYIAARFLLNNQFIIQGITLSSSAVEKYIKALIVLTSNEVVWYGYHLDNFNKLKGILERNRFDVTKNWDPVFLGILENAYKIRYYDRLKETIRIGFYLNQFIGELDDTVHSIEKLSHGMSYNRAIQNKDQHLYENNFILNKLNKKEYMERPDTAFSVRIQIGPVSHHEYTVVGRDISNKYEGHISVFSDPFEINWFDKGK